MSDADESAKLFDTEVQRVLDIRAPLQTRHCCHAQRDIHDLSDKARQAKQVSRRLERRHQGT